MAQTTQTISQQLNNAFALSTVENNWAFIDLQNVYKGALEAGWRIDWNRFRIHLNKTFSVKKAVIFLGRLHENQAFYNLLHSAGFVLEFREVIRKKDGSIDGANVDADVTSYIMDYKTNYSKAILIADDGDYCRTVQSLVRQSKLKLIISSHTVENSSFLIKRAVRPDMIVSIQNMKGFIGKNGNA